jgi:hypothetical protein
VRRLAALLLLAAACKGKEPTKDPVAVPPHPMPEPIAAPVAGEWALCKAALEAVPKLPPTKQVAALIDGCKPCGDWKPLLEWQTLTEDGGPKKKDIETTMLGCKAYCDPNAKMRFVNGLDEARGKNNRRPWRVLGEFCKAELSSVPDARFMSAPYFALDRIARDVAARPEGAKLLAAIDLVLPAVSVTGAGLELPTTAVTKPTAAPSHLTLTVEEIRAGALPHAKLGATGVTVTADMYPGNVVKLADLPAVFDKLPQPVLVFMPQKMSAKRLVEVLATTKRRPMQLAVQATSTLPGWDQYGAAPIDLVGEVDPATLPKDKAQRLRLSFGASADDAIAAITKAPATAFTAPPELALQPEATGESLAAVLGALAYKDVKTAVIVSGTRPKP